MKIYFFQCQEDYAGSSYLPYSSGILWAYASLCPEIKSCYILGDIFFEKLPLQDYIDKLESPDVICFSNYGWNTAYHLALAKQIKLRFPKVVIIVGGPNAQQDESYLRQNSYVDYVVWGEGEQTLTDLLNAISRSEANFSSIDGIAYIKNNAYIKTNQRQRKTDINKIPSPYLSGIFDDFFTRYDYNFMPVWETNRGCPYHCTFCDLGSSYYNKLYEFDTDRLMKEIQWFSDKKIEYVEIADANFGILARDLDLVKKIKELNVLTGYPQKINATWAKNSSDRVFTMSKILDSMNRGGVTLALQSTNPTALKNIKRFNIVNYKLQEIAQKYIDNNIQTYHDFILGLPGETLDSWKRGLLDIIDINPEGWIFGHPLEAYRNTEFSDPEYIEKFNLKFAATPQVSFFAKRKTSIPIEYGNYVISHSTMSKEDYIEGFMFKWFLILTHSLGWFKKAADIISAKEKIPRSSVYLLLFDWMKHNNCVLQSEYNLTANLLLTTINQGTFWGRQMFGDDDVYWEYESASSIVFEQNRDNLKNNFGNFIKDTFPKLDWQYISAMNDLSVISFSKKYPIQFDKFTIDAENYQSFEKFCQQIFWAGRRKKAWKTNIHE